MAGKPGHGGKKGVSGRRTKSVEQKRLDTIQKAWDITHDYLSSNAPLTEKVEQAVKLVTKNMPEKLEHSGSVNMLPAITIGGKPFAYDVGS
jgi:hypothetical protein